MTDFTALRRNMLESQIRTNKVTDQRVLDALLAVPREAFVPPDKASLAYIDDDLPVAPGRYLIEPRVFARMLQEVEIQPQDKVLIVGTGTGYSAAVVSRLAAKVVATEPDEALRAAATAALQAVGDVTVVAGDPAAGGYAAAAPYDVILVEPALAHVPPALFDQLAEGGRLVVVLRDGPVGVATLFGKSAAALGRRPLFNAMTPLLPGVEPPPSFVF